MFQVALEKGFHYVSVLLKSVNGNNVFFDSSSLVFIVIYSIYCQNASTPIGPFYSRPRVAESIAL